MNTEISKTQFGSWALITGASSGIGKAFAEKLASENVNLILAARRKHLLEELGEDLQRKHNIRYKAIVTDLSSEEGVEDLIKETGGHDIGLVVSNAGTGAPGEFIRKDMDNLLDMVRTSVLSHLKIAHYFGKRFAEDRRGGLILVSAMGAKNGLPFMANDAGTRAYIRSLGLGLHVELKRYNVHVTVLETTPTETPIVSELGFSEEKMPVKMLSAEQCVNETLKALRKNQPVILPGRKFRIMDRLVPGSIVRKMNGKMLAEGNGISW